MTKLPKQNLSRKDAALYRLGITAEQVAQSPQIAPIFGSSSNLRDAIAALRFSPDAVASRFLACYDKVPVGDRNYLSVEAIALKADVDFNELLGAMIFAFRSTHTQKNAIKAIAEHEFVLSSSLLYACDPKGVEDRRMLHQAVGFLPSPKGMSLNFNLPQAEAPKVVSEDTSPDVNEVFPTISEKEQTWQDRRSKLLEAEN